MPQLKKVVLAMGNRLIYRDTFEQALAELTSGAAAAAPARADPTAVPAPSRPAEQLPVLTERLRRLRDQAQQLVREIEAIEKDAGRR
jgi:uncharacterized membrane protein (UPF0182 family)